MKPVLVVSFYDRRPLEPLVALLDSLDRHPAGAPCDRLISINSTGAQALPAELRTRVDGIVERPNAGMNIGAWDAGWRHWRGRPAYLFLQDECFAVRDGWMRETLALLEQPDVGMVGEAFNPSWDKSWPELREGPGRDHLPEHFLRGKPANRVDVYLDEMRRHGIEPGPTGRHLRSLAWALRGEVMESLGGFPQGANYGECIAAEIGVSRTIDAMGLALRQFGPAPFHLFRHREWNQDRPGGPYTHKPVLLREMEKLRAEVKELRARIDHPAWSDLGHGLLARLGRARTEPRA